MSEYVIIPPESLAIVEKFWNGPITVWLDKEETRRARLLEVSKLLEITDMSDKQNDGGYYVKANVTAEGRRVYQHTISP